MQKNNKQDIGSLLKQVSIHHLKECASHSGTTCNCGYEEMQDILMQRNNNEEKVTDSDVKAFLLDGVQSTINDIGLRMSELAATLSDFQVKLSSSHKEKSLQDLDVKISKLENHLEVLRKAKSIYKNNV